MIFMQQSVVKNLKVIYVAFRCFFMNKIVLGGIQK